MYRKPALIIAQQLFDFLVPFIDPKIFFLPTNGRKFHAYDFTLLTLKTERISSGWL